MGGNTTPPSGPTLVLPQSTPVKADTSTTLPFTTTQKYRIESCTAMAEEIRRYLVGPMPAEQFLDDFFPLRNNCGLHGVPQFKPGCYSETVEVASEKQAYTPFIMATEKFTPGLKIVNSSSFPDSNQRSTLPFKIKPDISLYPAGTDATVKTDSAKAEIFIEFKWNTTDDPFCDVHDVGYKGGIVRSFLCDSKAADDTLGQITSYAAAQLGAQFRTHVFSVFIVKGTARILRWDRSGTIVTEAIEYNKSPLLAEFFCRYSVAMPEMRGNDRSALAPTVMEELRARETLDLQMTVPLVKLSIPNADGSPLYFITSTPEATLYTPPGRATRGFKAYDVSRKVVVFLKDSWRIDLPDIEAEGRVYRTLRDAQVCHVPHCLASGDISTAEYHATKTHEYVTKPWACHSDAHFTPHRHYRLVLDVVGRVLVQYKSSYEMVAAVRNALIAHMDAYNVGILHRDFSVGNIIIDPEGEGWLIDWDLSKPVLLDSETPRCATRTGTWQFMSAALISQMGVQHDFKDDLESSVYVLLWAILMYSETSDRDQVPSFLSTVLDPQPYGPTGGYSKADFLKGRTFLDEVKFPHRPELHKLINQLAQLFAVCYELKPTEGETEQANTLRFLAESLGDPKILDAYRGSPAQKYKQRMSELETHMPTILLFEAALCDRSKWPTNDFAVKQIFCRKPSSRPITKTGWSTTLFMTNVKSDVESRHSDDEDVGELDHPMGDLSDGGR